MGGCRHINRGSGALRSFPPSISNPCPLIPSLPFLHFPFHFPSFISSTRMSLPRFISEDRGDSGYHDMPLYRKKGPGGAYANASLGRLRRVWRTIQQRPILRWCLITTLFLFIAVSSLEVRRRKANWSLPTVETKPPGEFDDCPGLLAALDASMSHYPNTNNTDNDNNGNNDESGWARTMLPNDLLAMLERGEKIPRNIIHQSWKNRDVLPEYFERWSKDWRRLHGRDWV